MSYTHVFFDLDHTIWDFDSNAKEALMDLYVSYELETKILVSFELFYRTYLRHNAILWDRYEKGYITTEELKWRRMWRTLLDFKIADEKLSKDLAISFPMALKKRNAVNYIIPTWPSILSILLLLRSLIL